MPKAKVGVSMLYCLGEPFNRMVKRLDSMNTRTMARMNLTKNASSP